MAMRRGRHRWWVGPQAQECQRCQQTPRSWGEAWTSFSLRSVGGNQDSWHLDIGLLFIENLMNTYCVTGFLGGTVVMNLPASAGEVGLIPGFRRSPEGGNSYPLQCSCLENSMDGGAWWATVHGVAKSWAWLSMHTSTIYQDLCWRDSVLLKWV